MNEINLYLTENNQTQVEVLFDRETVWPDQYQLTELFQTDRTSILKHMKDIYLEKELQESSIFAIFAQVRKKGNKMVSRKILNYNLDLISVGYRVNCKRCTQFRQWATQRLKYFLVKGYAINQKRLDELQQTVQIIQKSFSYHQYLTV